VIDNLSVSNAALRSSNASMETFPLSTARTKSLLTEKMTVGFAGKLTG